MLLDKGLDNMSTVASGRDVHHCNALVVILFIKLDEDGDSSSGNGDKGSPKSLR